MLHTHQNPLLPLDYYALDFSPLTWFPFVQTWTEVDGVSLDFTTGLYIYPGLMFPYGPLETMTHSLDIEHGLFTNYPLWRLPGQS